MNEPSDAPLGRREANRRETQQRIEDAIVAMLLEGDLARVTHDALASRTGIARRTIYRYFPDQQALLDNVWERVTALAGPKVRMPESEADMLDTLPAIYEGFDRIAALETLIRSTPQGRALRMARNDRRVRSYTAAMAAAVKDLPPTDARQATAMLQFLHTSAWLEMRDHWGLTGTEIARVCRWAMRTLLADLRARGGRPLDAEAD